MGSALICSLLVFRKMPETWESLMQGLGAGRCLCKKERPGMHKIRGVKTEKTCSPARFHLNLDGLASSMARSLLPKKWVWENLGQPRFLTDEWQLFLQLIICILSDSDKSQYWSVTRTKRLYIHFVSYYLLSFS